MKIFPLRRDVAKTLCWVGLACLTACPADDRTPTTGFAGPTGMALAGSAFDRVYVANTGTDSLQVIRLAQNISGIDLAPAPARYFPLNIPAGPSVSQVAASRDGQWVFALDAITSTVRLVDADAQRLARDGAGDPLALAVGPSNAQAAVIVGSPWPCEPSEANPSAQQSVCVARAYIGLRRLHSVVAVDVRAPGGGGPLSLRVDSTYAVGAAPLQMAAHPTEPVLFITDALTPQVVRLALPGANRRSNLSRMALDAPAGAVSVSGDGQVLAVARPILRDVALVVGAGGDLAYGTMVALDANPAFAPEPTCVAACGQPEGDLCAGAHAADLGLCSQPAGYSSTARPYTALYLGSVPQALASISSTRTGAPLIEPCASAGGEQDTAFAEAFAVASLDGTVQYIGVAPDPATGEMHARVLDAASCDAPRLTAMRPSVSDVADLLLPCASLPDGRARMVCLADPDAEAPPRPGMAAAPATGRVGLMRGVGRHTAIGLQWEGILPGGDRSGGGGAIDALGRLYDAGAGATGDLATLDIVGQQRDRFGRLVQRGDIVEVLTLQLANAQCGDNDGSPLSICQMERRVVAVHQGSGPTALELDPPLDASCFPQGVQISYRIRVGDAFLAGPVSENQTFTQKPVRLAPGDTYGAGLLAGATDALFFTLRADLDAGLTLSPCERYVGGKPGASLFGVAAPAWRSREGMTAFAVQDPRKPIRAGVLVDPLQGSSRNGGRMPGALVMTRGANGVSQAAVNPPVLLVSFSGSDSVLITSPMDLSSQPSGEPKERYLN